MRKEFDSPEFVTPSFPEGRLKPNLFAHKLNVDQIHTRADEIARQAHHWKADAVKKETIEDTSVRLFQEIKTIADEHEEAEIELEPRVRCLAEAKRHINMVKHNPLITEVDINRRIIELEASVKEANKRVLRTNNKLIKYELNESHTDPLV